MDNREAYMKLNDRAGVLIDAIRQKWRDEEKQKQRLANEFSKLVKERIAA